MAERRMFTQKIIDSDPFLDMPLSTQALYFHLNMRADDDGFINNPKKIARMVGASEDDLKLLIAKRFVLTFENGVIVIKHWRMHNLIRKDRYSPTQYQEELKKIIIKDNGSYTEKPAEIAVVELDNHLATTWQPNGNHLATQERKGKDSIDIEIEEDKNSSLLLSSSQRVAKHRENKKICNATCNATVTQSNAIEEEEEIEEDKDKDIYTEEENNKYIESSQSYSSVGLSITQYEELCRIYGKLAVDSRIEKMDQFQKTKHKKYKNPFETLKSWLSTDSSKPKKKPTAGNERTYTEAELEQLEKDLLNN